MKNENRHLTSVASKVVDNDKYNTLILTSSSDTGVRLNSGRAGTALGPKALCYHFLKMNDHLINITGIKKVEVSSIQDETINFEKAQELESSKIDKSISTPWNSLIHIGGGHDHVYPLLLSLQKIKSIKRILIVNIDAHCDTRIDNIHHSGTPFRDFDKVCKINTTLIQYGIHKYANSSSTLSSLEKVKQTVIYQNQKLDLNLEQFNNEESLVLLSLDSDGLDSSIMRAVSAVNSQGVLFSQALEVIQHIKELKCKKVFGIYEYNPKFDDLSNQGAKILSHLMYKWLE